MSTPHQAPTQLDVGKIRLALGDPDTPGLVLFTIVLWSFGPAVMGDPENDVDQMDPAELWAALNESYGTWVTEEGENKLNAILLGLTAGMFWRDTEVFQSVSTALFDGDLGDVVAGEFEDLTATEIMWAVLEMELVWDDEAPTFSPRVQSVIDNAMQMEQEDQSENFIEIDRAYQGMLDQLVDMGVPVGAIRSWDEEYATVREELEEAAV